MISIGNIIIKKKKKVSTINKIQIRTKPFRNCGNYETREF